MSLSRTSLVPVMAAAGCLLLFSCRPAAQPAGSTAATTESTAAAARATTATSTSGMAATATNATAQGMHYGRTKEKLGKAWGKNNAEEVTVQFDGTNVKATPDPAELNAADEKKPGGPTKVTWTAEIGVVLHVRVVTPAGEPSCIKEDSLHCKDNVCTAEANPEQYTKPQKDWYSASCKVKIWKDGMSEPDDPDIVIDNCCP